MRVIGRTKRKKQKAKSVSFWFIRDTRKLFLDEANSIPNIVSLTTTPEEAEEFISRKLMGERSEHFKSWCDLRDLKQNAESWDKYYRKVLRDSNPYTYYKLEVDVRSVAGICRIFYGCVPIGCSFDTLIETINMLSNFSKEDLEDLKDVKEN